jgi:hypothetical protein
MSFGAIKPLNEDQLSYFKQMFWNISKQGFCYDLKYNIKIENVLDKSTNLKAYNISVSEG